MLPIKSPFRIYLEQIGVRSAEIARAVGRSETLISRIVGYNEWKIAAGAAAILRENMIEFLVSRGADQSIVESFLDNHIIKPQDHAMDQFILNHFGLPSSPFAPNRIKEKYVLQTEEHTRLVSRLESAAEECDFLFVIGNQGAGKSTAIAVLEPKLIARKIKLCKFMASDVPKTEAVLGYMVQAMHETLGLPDRKQYNQQTKLRMIKEHLATSETGLAVLVDDAHTLHPMTLLGIKRRWDALTVGFRRLVGFILLGQPRIWSTLRADGMAEVKDHSEQHEIMGLLNDGEVARYIEAKMKPFAIAANCGIDRWFSPDVPGRIFQFIEDGKLTREKNLRYQMAQIFPRELNGILIALFETAYKAEDTQITADHVNHYFAVYHGAKLTR